jgi:hypothetical protein
MTASFWQEGDLQIIEAYGHVNIGKQLESQLRESNKHKLKP